MLVILVLKTANEDAEDFHEISVATHPRMTFLLHVLKATPEDVKLCFNIAI